MKTHLQGAFVITAETALHFTCPDSSSRAILCYLFEEVVVRIKEEGHARNEAIKVETCFDAPRHILDTIAQSERELLDRSGAGFTNVITAHGNWVVTRNAIR